MRAPKTFCQTFVAPKGVETFQNDVFPDCRRFIHLGRCETSAFGGLGELFYIRVRESELEKVFSSSFLFFEMCWWYLD